MRNIEDAEKGNRRPPPKDTHPDTKNWSDEEKVAFLEKNTALIRSMVSQIRQTNDVAVSQEDLFQEAQIAFWNAFTTYNPNRGTLFTTYAHRCMRNAINEKLRATNARKRRPPLPPVPYDSTVSADGEELPGGDNMRIPQSPDLSMDEMCMIREMTENALKVLQDVCTSEEQDVFLALSQKQKTQVELAKEYRCSQAKISVMYKAVKARVRAEMIQMGFTSVDLA